jgi:hypothetical protein
MALFTDAPISTLDQLAAQDSAALDVASTEGIDATAKISLGQDELGIELVAAVSRSPFSPATPSVWWPGMVLTTTLQLSSIVVTPPLRLWHTFHTLELIYRDAYNNQLNDRYLGKWHAYTDLAKWACSMLMQTGVGVVSDPVAVAQVPQVDVTSGSFQATNYFVQAAWMNSHGEEGMASAVASATASDQNSIQVTATSPPGNATAWNVYAGTSINSITLQNSAPIDTGQPWLLPVSGLVSGRSPGTGQAPSYYRVLPRYLQRG